VYLVQVRHAVCSYSPGEARVQETRRVSATWSTRRKNRLPFCFTVSKDATRSDNEPGNAFRCTGCCGCCCCCGCGCCCCGNADGGRCTSSLTPGGNWGSCACVWVLGGNGDEASAGCCCCCCCCCDCSGGGERTASGTEVLVAVMTGAGACHALPACPSVDGGAADC
jgi:hypothetical protein